MQYYKLSLLALCVSISTGVESRTLNAQDITRLQQACQSLSAGPASLPGKAHTRKGKGKGRTRAMTRLCATFNPPPPAPIELNPTPPVFTPPPNNIPPPLFAQPPGPASLPGLGLLGTEQIPATLTGQSLTASTPGAVPVPAAAWLFGSGLLGMIAVAKRRRRMLP